MKKILIVEDDHLIAEIERDYLEANGYEAEICLTGLEGLKKAKSEDYALLLLDVMLPEVSGFDICREIRKTQETPIILVTARKEDIDIIRGLGLGADDYIVKPFNPSELVARVKAHIGIHEMLREKTEERKEKSQERHVGRLLIQPLSRRVYVGDQEISLANKEYELLIFFVDNPEIVFSKETLFDRVWGMDAVGDTATVTVHVNRLREKIEENPSKPQMIETIWGVGYRFHLLIQQ